MDISDKMHAALGQVQFAHRHLRNCLVELQSPHLVAVIHNTEYIAQLVNLLNVSAYLTSLDEQLLTMLNSFLNTPERTIKKK